MNPLIFVILIIMILFTVYHFWTDIRNYLNTGETFAEGFSGTRDSRNDFQYKCSTGGTYATYSANTLTPAQKAKAAELYPGQPASYYACVQGCSGSCEANGDGVMKSVVDAPAASGGSGGSGNNLVLNSPISGNFSAGTQVKTDGSTGNTGSTRDSRNDFQYKCSTGGTYATYSANTLTPAQKAKAAELYPGKPASYYACVQGCSGGCEANGDGVMKSVVDAPAGNTVTTTDAQGNTITTTTTESSSVDPTTGAKTEKKCISVSELSSASAWVDHLFGTLGDTKCANKSKVEAAKTASKMDFISGVIKGYQNEREESNEYYMSAISKAKPYLDQAFSGNGVSGDENNLAQATDQTVSTNTQQTEAPVVNDIQAPQPPVWQAEAMAQNFSNQQQQPAQPAQQVINNQVLPNGFIVQPGNGKCPNGCKFPQYDNDKCTDIIVNGKGYRKCPWVKDGMNSEDCAECGAILMPKNEYGYARTRPGLFDSVSIGLATENSKTDNKSDYYNIGKNFMTQLSNIKNFKMPSNIETDEFVSIGKMVHKFQTEKSDSSKKMLTDFVNQILTTGLDSANGRVKRNSMVTVELNESGGNFDLDVRKLSMKGAYAYDEGKKEVSSDNRLGGSRTMYEKNLSERVRRRNGIPRDPRKRPQPYDSIWDIFKY